VAKVLFSLHLRLLSAGRLTRLDEAMASSRSFVRARGVFDIILCLLLSSSLCSTSEVTIGIKNQGDEAFKPEVYGKSIFVSRRFTKEGSSSYKIKSADGKIVSTKRDELSAICDHMNIQVDNPMNILTQGSCRFSDA